MTLGIDNFTYATFLSLDYGKSSGSGFSLRYRDCEYIVTAKHVLINENGDIRENTLLVTSQNYIGELDDARTIEIELDAINVIFSETEDIAVISLGNNEHYNIQQEGNNIVQVTVDDISKLEDIQISNDVLLVGFPTSLYMEGAKFFDINRPLLRKGIIAGINEKDNTFIIDCPAYYGNSGGPVLDSTDKNDLKIIGLVSRYIPFVTEWRNNREQSFSRQEFSNSGYAVCIPLDNIFELLKK